MPFSGISYDRKQIRTIGDEFIIDLECDIFERIQCCLSFYSWKWKKQIKHRLSFFRFELSLVPVFLEDKNTFRTTRNQSEFLLATYHAPTDYAGHSSFGDFKVRTEFCTDHSNRNICGVHDIRGTSQYRFFTVNSEINSHNGELLAIWMLLTCQHFSYHNFINICLYNIINFCCMN